MFDAWLAALVGLCREVCAFSFREEGARRGARGFGARAATTQKRRCRLRGGRRERGTYWPQLTHFLDLDPATLAAVHQDDMRTAMLALQVGSHRPLSVVVAGRRVRPRRRGRAPVVCRGGGATRRCGGGARGLRRRGADDHGSGGWFVARRSEEEKTADF
jgi:hypothetical protein